MPIRIVPDITIDDLIRDRRAFVTVGEAASIMRADPRTIREMARDG
jgi:hypothetical protein